MKNDLSECRIWRASIKRHCYLFWQVTLSLAAAGFMVSPAGQEQAGTLTNIRGCLGGMDGNTELWRQRRVFNTSWTTPLTTNCEPQDEWRHPVFIKWQKICGGSLTTYFHCVMEVECLETLERCSSFVRKPGFVEEHEVTWLNPVSHWYAGDHIVCHSYVCVVKVCACRGRKSDQLCQHFKRGNL